MEIMTAILRLPLRHYISGTWALVSSLCIALWAIAVLDFSQHLRSSWFLPSSGPCTDGVPSSQFTFLFLFHTTNSYSSFSSQLKSCFLLETFSFYTRFMLLWHLALLSQHRLNDSVFDFLHILYSWKQEPLLSFSLLLPDRCLVFVWHCNKHNSSKLLTANPWAQS